MPDSDHKQALPPGFRLGSYRVVRVLGAGGFGVTYLCEHTGLRVQVAVKEYLPNEIAVREGVSVHPKSAGDREGFEWGLSRFLDEARTLTRFEHRNLVRVRDCFEANNTAYIVMDYEEGESLDRLLQRLGTLTEGQLRRVLLPVADGLRQVHAAGFLHRDVKPSNTFVRRSDESLVLLDFGSARQALGCRSKNMAAIASAGYSRPEQYESDDEQGPWTDIYALSALCYRAIVGRSTAAAPRRRPCRLSALCYRAIVGRVSMEAPRPPSEPLATPPPSAGGRDPKSTESEAAAAPDERTTASFPEAPLQLWADQGDAAAQSILGRMYVVGKDFPNYYVQAAFGRNPCHCLAPKTPLVRLHGGQGQALPPLRPPVGHQLRGIRMTFIRLDHREHLRRSQNRVWPSCG